MSEAKGPFDAVIWYLGSAAGDSETWSEKFITELRTAIRVLEVAGKVDKVEMLGVLTSLLDLYKRSLYAGLSISEREGCVSLMTVMVNQIRALLEALPPKEEKR